MAEFKARPFGVHSPELHAMLNVLRAADMGGKIVLVCTKLRREWRLAQLRGAPLGAQFLDLPAFDSLEAAEWAVFELRWLRLVGVPLGID